MIKKFCAVLIFLCTLFLVVGCQTNNYDTELSGELTQSNIDKSLKLYPLSTEESEYFVYSYIPEIIFSTTGAENGLSGNIYSFSGTMVGQHPELGPSYFVVATKYGVVLMMNIYNDVKDELPVEEEKYIIPEVGEEARFTCIYDGFSTVAGMPCFAYGNDELLLSSYLDSDKENSKEEISAGESAVEDNSVEESVNDDSSTPSQPIVYKGSGDKVITNIDLENGRYKAHVVYYGEGVFSVFGYDAEDDMVLMKSSYGACDSEDLLRGAEFPIILEITASGKWEIEFEKID